MAISPVNLNYINDVSHLTLDKGAATDQSTAKQVLQDIGTLSADGSIPTQGQFVADIAAGAHESLSSATVDATSLKVAISSKDADTLNQWVGAILGKVETAPDADATRLCDQSFGNIARVERGVHDLIWRMGA